MLRWEVGSGWWHDKRAEAFGLRRILGWDFVYRGYFDVAVMAFVGGHFGIAQLWSQKFNSSQGWLIGWLSIWRYNIFLVLRFFSFESKVVNFLSIGFNLISKNFVLCFVYRAFFIMRLKNTFSRKNESVWDREVGLWDFSFFCLQASVFRLKK